jgi:hypothetical protein
MSLVQGVIPRAWIMHVQDGCGLKWGQKRTGGKGAGHGGTHQVDALDNYPHFLSENPNDLAFLALVLPSDDMHLKFSLVRIPVRYGRITSHNRTPPPPLPLLRPSLGRPHRGRVEPRDHPTMESNLPPP